MNGILVALGAAAGKMAMSIITSMLSEQILKRAIILALEKLVDKTDNTWDNDLLSELRLEWQVPKYEKTTTTTPSGDPS